MTIAVLHDDCMNVLRAFSDNRVDAIVTDPPYGLGFMGKAWDDLPPGLPWAQECLRVIKPGGYLLAFGGARTWHRLAVAIEDAGFELRDSIAWLYGSGFPKSLDVSKAVDGHVARGRSDSKSLADVNAERPGEATVRPASTNGHRGFVGSEDCGPREKRDTPATPAAEQWAGWGTALKPAFEPIVVARKPLSGTVAANVLAHGTGALNIDGCRVPGDVPSVPQPDFCHVNGVTTHLDAHRRNGEMSAAEGRWPANAVLDDSAAAELDEQSGTLTSGANPTRRGSDKSRDTYGDFRGQEQCAPARGADSGGASRFFPTFRYQAKAPTRERPTVLAEDGTKTAHPTVKPLGLMRWLVRLVTPPGGVVLDPFAGSGATVEACILEDFDCIAVEREAEYLPLIQIRIQRSQPDGEAAS